MAKARSPRPMKVEPNRHSTLPPLDSGFRSRKNAYSPASGVRSARDGQPIPPMPRTPDESLEPARVEFESDIDLEPARTRPPFVPDDALLALARGAEQADVASEPDEKANRGRAPRARFLWFVLGIAVGVGVAWGVASNDVSPEVYRARVWAAKTLRSIRGKQAEPEVPAPSAAPTSPTPLPTSIPTVDVTQLPKAHEPAGEEEVAPALPPMTNDVPTRPGAPALSHAPGPR
jgi:hypothetical protein